MEREPTPQEEAEYDAFVERQEDGSLGEALEVLRKTGHVAALARVEDELAARSKFSQLESKLAAKKTKSGKQKIKNPGGLAYAIGKAKYGAAGMAKKAAAGKAKASK